MKYGIFISSEQKWSSRQVASANMNNDTINDAVTMADGNGTLLAGRYHVVRQLGQGGMGSVWLVEDMQLDNKRFAVKMLPSILVTNKRAYRQLKDEALVAMKLTHPNIVTLRAFEENNGNPFLVMDYIDGQTLDDYLSEKGTLAEDETIKILHPIAAALDYAHSKGVVHRDVKPGNVMIAKDGTPYILDFGIAREIQETMTRVTGKLSSGTLLYMSPEQLHGAAPKKEQDVYSFAAMAYECLAGAPPFNRGQIEYRIDNDTPEPLQGRVTSNTPLAAGIMAGLAKKPEGRPAICADVLGCGAQLRLCNNSSRICFGKWFVALSSIVALCGAICFFWMRIEETIKAKEIRIAKIEDEKKAIEEEIRRREKELAEERLKHEKVVAANTEEDAKSALAEQEAKRKEVAALARLRVDIKIKADDAKDKMELIANYRGEPDGFAMHIANADEQWRIVQSVDMAPATSLEASASLKKVSDSESVIARELHWLKTNKADRDEAKALESEILRDITPDLERFKVSAYASAAFAEGDRLRREGNEALVNGDFASAKSKLGEAKSKLSVATNEAKEFCIKTHLDIAGKWYNASKWEDCISEADKVLEWDAHNGDALSLKRKSEIAIAQRDKERKALELATKKQKAPEKPRVYLTATLNGISKNALITGGMQENNRYVTPLYVDVNIPIGSTGEFSVEYFENGTKYTGNCSYTSKNGLQRVEVELQRAYDQKMYVRPLTMNFCRHCGYSLKDFSAIGQKCPKCGKDLFGR